MCRPGCSTRHWHFRSTTCCCRCTCSADAQWRDRSVFDLVVMPLFEFLRDRLVLRIALASVGFLALRTLVASLPDWILWTFLAGVALWGAVDWLVQTEPVRRFVRESRLRRVGGRTAP